MILAVDAGNTLVKMGVVSPHAVLSRIAAPADRCVTPSDLAGLATTAIAQAPNAMVRRVAVSCVVPRLRPLIWEALSGLPVPGGLGPLWVRNDLRLGITVATRRPECVGSDRITDAVAASELFGRPVIAVSCGTTLTVTVVDADGMLLGGAIAPGPVAAARCLASATGQLPDVALDSEMESVVLRALGRDTDEAIRAGVLHGLIGGLRSLIRGIHDELRARPPLVLTGGYAEALARCIGPEANVVRDLTFRGLRLIADRNPD